MSTADAEALKALLSQLTSLPPDTNPYSVLLHTVFSATLPEPPSWFKSCMLSNYVLASLGLIASAAVVALKVTNRGGWIYRTRDTASGRLLTPNTTFLLSLFSLLYFSLAIPSVHFIMDAYVYRQDSIRYQRLQGVLWLAIASMTWVETAGMAVACYLSQNTRSDTQLKKRISTSHRIPKIPTWVLNSLVLSFFPVYWASALSVFGYVGRKNADAWAIYYEIERAVESARIAWVPGEAIKLGAWLPLVGAYAREMQHVLSWIGKGFLVHATAILFALVCFLPVSVIYIRMLKRQMSMFASAHQQSNSQQYTSSNKEINALKNTYRLMAIETAVILVFSLFYAGLATWIGVDVQNITVAASSVCLAWVLAFTSFSALNLILVSVILYRTVVGVLSQRRANKTSSSPDRGITVQTQVYTHIDVDDNKQNAAYQFAEMRMADFHPQQLQPISQPTVVTFDLDKRPFGMTGADLKQMELDSA